MKISSVDFFYLSLPEVRDIGDGSQDALLVRVEADGHVGWGECEAAPLVSIASWNCPMSHSACKPVSASVLGQRLDNVDDIRRINACVREHSFDLLQADHTLSGIDIALWDLKAKAAGLPLWKLLGGNRPAGIEAYNTDGGWLNLGTEQVVENCRRFVGEGYRGVKIKIGSPNPNDDLRRIEAVRAAIGPDIKFMVDANGKWDLPTALNHARKFEDHDIYWFEEPLWYDDVEGHAALARATRTPVALGEQLYSLDAFAAFVKAGAVHYVQADVTRLGGITEWLQVADLALAHRLPVAPHAGDMGQIHLHTALAHPACTIVEFIPWIRHCFEEPITVKDGLFIPPQQPGAGSTLTVQAHEKFGVR